MGFFKKLAKAGINAATLPISAAKDFVTIGGLSTNQPEPYTAQTWEEMQKNLKKAYDKL